MRCVAPAQSRLCDGISIAGGDVDRQVLKEASRIVQQAIIFPRFDQENALVGKCAQAIGDNAARGAGADDDVVEVHCYEIPGVTSVRPWAPWTSKLLSASHCVPFSRIQLHTWRIR